MDNKESQCRNEDIGKHNYIIIIRKRHRHNDYNRIGERNDDSLFGVLNENYDKDNIVEIRNANR
jgi:hypothetical protein